MQTTVRGVRIRLLLENDLICSAFSPTDTNFHSIDCIHPLAFDRLLRGIIEQVAYNWRPKRFMPIKVKHKLLGPLVNHALHPWWTEMRAGLDPEWIRLQNRLYSVFGHYRTEYVTYQPDGLYAKDIFEHRAAAYVMAAMVNELNGFGPEMAGNGTIGWKNQTVKPPFFALPESWVEFVCPKGTPPYKALYQTLLAWPTAMPMGMVSALRRQKLERPLLNKLELLVYKTFCVATMYDAPIVTPRDLALNLNGRADDNRMGIFWRTKPEDILTALGRVADYLKLNRHGKAFSFRRSEDVEQLVNYMLDYPDKHQGDMRGLATKSITYHRSLQQRQQAQATAEARILSLPEDALFPIIIPPDELPPGVRQLCSRMDLIAEGSLMGHCIGDSAYYAGSAHRGAALHFHVESSNGEMATCTVSSGGRMMVEGPSYGRNSACVYAQKECKQFADRLTDKQGFLF